MINKKLLAGLLLASVIGLASCTKANGPSITTGTTTTIPTTGTTTVPTTVPTIVPTEVPTIGTTNIPTTEIPTTGVELGDVLVTAYAGLQESAFVEFDNVLSATGYNIYLKGKKYIDFTLLNEKNAYISDTNTGKRLDLIGLEAGNYSIKIVPKINGVEHINAASVCSVVVDNYDRSGYAHFNYSDGVGAYKDNGTLKDNAIILYVTDENKNSIELSYGGTTVTGIGNILNTAGMDTGGGKNSKGGRANTNDDILKKLADNNIPLVVRFVGTVSNSGLYKQGTFAAASKPLINGLTIYDSIDDGGSEGDNGHMARMKSAYNVTLEGIGAGAIIDGWGFHFMCSTSDKGTNRGTSFEVRNLVFINTPEDAVGMEGTQGILGSDGVTVTGASSTSSDILGSVERCWVHDNEFYCPSISGPAEGDKAEGDGSVDFKRGQYFTCSYNYFEGCHKTNLVGSSDSSLQFNLTYHHNYWKNCGARGPLARNANIHMYNNIFEGQNSYAMNPRADSYIFSEYNMFYKCKNPQQVKDGALKSYNDNFASIIGECNGTIVSSRNEAVANSCKFQYRNIDYSKFELDSKLSYIPTNNYKFETDFTELRKDVVLNAGTQGRINKTKETLTLSDWSIFSALGDVTPIEVGVPFESAPGKLAKTIYAFKVNTMFTINAQFAGGVLVNEAGEALLLEGGELGNLPAGTYAIQPVNFGNESFSAADFKEVKITAFSIVECDSEEYNRERIAEYNRLLSNIPAEIAYTDSCYNSIKAATDYYNSLGKLKEEVDYNTLKTAYDAYVSLGVSYVEGLINSIGTVTVDSGKAISTARVEYDKLMTKASNAEVSNYSVLAAAEELFVSYAVTSCINKINLIGTVTLDSKDAIKVARNEYDLLSDSQKANVTNYSLLTKAEAEYQVLFNVNNVDLLIDNVNVSSAESMLEVITSYNNLTAEEKALVNDKDKYSNICVTYTILLINNIGEVTSMSGEAITNADNMYQSLGDEEKALVTNYSVLVDAKNVYSTLIIEYTIGWNSKTEALSGKFGTTISGFTYVCNKFDNGAMCVKKSEDHYLKTPELNGINATITITAYIVDTSKEDTLEVVCYYADGTS